MKIFMIFFHEISYKISSLHGMISTRDVTVNWHTSGNKAVSEIFRITELSVLSIPLVCLCVFKIAFRE
jgi:hypothetical protein